MDLIQAEAAPILEPRFAGDAKLGTKTLCRNGHQSLLLLWTELQRQQAENGSAGRQYFLLVVVVFYVLQHLSHCVP